MPLQSLSLPLLLAATEQSLTALDHLDSLALLPTLPVDQVPLPHHLVFRSVNFICLLQRNPDHLNQGATELVEEDKEEVDEGEDEHDAQDGDEGVRGLRGQKRVGVGEVDGGALNFQM